jgi:hypothetical protein
VLGQPHPDELVEVLMENLPEQLAHELVDETSARLAAAHIRVSLAPDGPGGRVGRMLKAPEDG